MKYPLHSLEVGQEQTFRYAKINSLRVCVHAFSQLTGRRFFTSNKNCTPKVKRLK